jgi:hypothetical protein
VHLNSLIRKEMEPHVYQFALAMPFRGLYFIVIIPELPCMILRVHILIFRNDKQWLV